MRSYEAARSVFALLELLAWGLIIFGAIIALVGGFGASEMSRWGGQSRGLAFLMGIIPGMSMAFGGFLLLALAQIGRAGVDTAEYSQQMLQLSRDQLEVSRQGLRQKDDEKGSFVALKAPIEVPKTASFGALVGALQPEAVAVQDERKPASKDAAPLEAVAFKDLEIQSLERGYRFKGIDFDSLDAARAYVDRYVENANANPKLPT